MSVLTFSKPFLNCR